MSGTITGIIPVASATKLLKKGGAHRVSDKGSKKLKEVLEDIGLKIAQKSVRISLHSGRKTVKEKDIKLASEDLTL